MMNVEPVTKSVYYDTELKAMQLKIVGAYVLEGVCGGFGLYRGHVW